MLQCTVVHKHVAISQNGHDEDTVITEHSLKVLYAISSSMTLSDL